MITTGEKAPDFTLTADDGREISLRDYVGRKVILYFYPKDDTPGCTREAVEFKEVSDQFQKEGAVIVGVSKDNVESHRKFKEKYSLPFTLLSDPVAKVLQLYGVWKEKKLYARTFMGIERTTFLIDEKGVVVKVYQKVKPEGHAEVCLLDLKATQELLRLE
jgi:peroxiredoxin Q/BCP